ncbi:MAG TPA: AAA domain-containing protein, partial [Blastocatellia bacterium]|nr:AAA domain-containing protein [Blastocatellia bacterium]
RLEGEREERFLSGFGLDTTRVAVSPGRPDLLELLPPLDKGEPHKLRIWDYKASSAARHEHFIQVAYYSYLLDFALREAGITDPVVDLDYAVIRSREPEKEPFELSPYRLAVREFIESHVPRLFDTAAADTHFHVAPGCMMCEYADHCRAEADAGFDLSRIAYLTSESRRQLRRAGVKTHRELARVDDSALLASIRTAGYDLTVNLDRYLATARSLEDGQARPLGALTLLMPRYEDVRVIVTVEHDPVTNTCFALGLKTFEGWDAASRRIIGSERVFIAKEKGAEAGLLFDFLQTLNGLLERVDAANRAVEESFSLETEPNVATARRQADAAATALDAFKARHQPLRKTDPDYESLAKERDALTASVRQAKRAVAEARSQTIRVMQRSMKRLHFYLYDQIDLKNLEGLIERNLFSDDPPGLLAEITRLVRIFPADSIIPDANTFRSVPGTIVTQVLRALVALPTPYQFDLKSVSEAFQPRKDTGEEAGFLFRYKYGFAWDSSNQLAFERIHDVWDGKRYSVEGQFDLSPNEILEQMEKTLLAKLRATDSVVRRLKQEYKDGLRLRKEPFRFYSDFNPLNFQTLEALRVFAVMENSLDELAIKHIHTLPVEDRNNKFVCIRGLRYQEACDAAGNSLWFSFDPSSRDAKIEAGDYNLVVTNEDEPDALMGKVDGKLFDQTTNWWLGYYKVRVEEFDLSADPPRVRLLPDKPDKFREAVDLSRPCVLDQVYSDYNTPKILDVLARLHNGPQQARHVHGLLRDGVVEGWQPVVAETQAIEQRLRRIVSDKGVDADRVLNAGQWRAFHGVFVEPLTLVWGPPGTGKTHTLAHILLGYAIAAQTSGRKIGLLVTAFTHHAIVNVMRKVAELADEYGLDEQVILLRQLRGSGSAAHDELPERVALASDRSLESLIAADSQCVVVGSTVWSVYKAMREAGGAVQQWFDVVLIDEASQMKLPDALIAFSAARESSNIILAGDDQQLPPIIHGVYPEEHRHMLSSVFAFVRDQIDRAPETQPSRLFQLEDNFRMNEPLTAYPREALYRGRFNSIKPESRIITAPAISEESRDALDALLLPSRPVVLCSYSAPRSYTARNPVEAELVALMTERLSRIMTDEVNGRSEAYQPIEFARKGVAVLSPHRAQNSAIRQALRGYGFGADDKPMPLVDTVDKLQGKERAVIFVSYGVADSEYATAEAEFLLSSNRFNVAVTRAQKKVVVLCSEQVLNVVPSDKRTLLDSMMLKEFRRYCSDGRIRLP